MIAVGCYVKSLSALAIQVGERIGPVMADLGNNSCQVPFAPDYIRKVQQRGPSGRSARRRNAEGADLPAALYLAADCTATSRQTPSFVLRA